MTRGQDILHHTNTNAGNRTAFQGALFAAGAAKEKKLSPVASLIFMVLLYFVFLSAILTVFLMNTYFISVPTAVALLTVFAAAALLLLARILYTR